MLPKIEPNHNEIRELLIDNIISDMTSFLMRDYDYTFEKALNCIYNSNTIVLLQNVEGELYVQSSLYVYEILLKELKLYPRFEDPCFTNVAESL